MTWESQWPGVAFAATAVASVAICAVALALAATDSAAQALGYGLDVMTDAPLETLLVVLVSATAGGIVGARRAGTLGRPSTVWPGRIHPDIGRGMWIATQAFAVGTISLSVALTLAWASGTAAGLDPASVLFGGVYASVLFLLLGSFTVLPVALVLFAVVARQIGRVRSGTRTEAPGLDETSPPTLHA